MNQEFYGDVDYSRVRALGEDVYDIIQLWWRRYQECERVEVLMSAVTVAYVELLVGGMRANRTPLAGADEIMSSLHKNVIARLRAAYHQQERP